MAEEAKTDEKVTTEVKTSKEVTPVVEPTKKKNNDWWKWLLALLVLSFMIPVCFGVGLLARNEAVNMFKTIPPAAEEKVKVVVPEDVVLYTCKAQAIGTPTDKSGECDFCTINYAYPGDVYVVGKEKMEYQAGAWVYQYPRENWEGFKTCIVGQDFFSDPDYTTVWK